MTTIAYRNGTLACDSAWTAGGTLVTMSTKIMRLKSGALFGHSGDNDCRKLREMVENARTFKQLPSHSDLTALKQQFAALIIFPARREVFMLAASHVAHENWDENFEEDIGVWKIDRGYAAIGTGGDAALGALAMGATAAVAVRVGCMFDPNSRLPVHTLSLPKRAG